jgi:hypothetical protein
VAPNAPTIWQWEHFLAQLPLPKQAELRAADCGKFTPRCWDLIKAHFPTGMEGEAIVSACIVGLVLCSVWRPA